MEGYTARDALIVMRLDLAEALHEINEEIGQLDETLELSGIAEQLLTDDASATAYPAIRRWLQTVSNHTDLERDKQELCMERDELVQALKHLEQRLIGKQS